MGADILYLSPCCENELHRDLENGYCECSLCGNIFKEGELRTEVIDYEEAI